MTGNGPVGLITPTGKAYDAPLDLDLLVGWGGILPLIPLFTMPSPIFQKFHKSSGVTGKSVPAKEQRQCMLCGWAGNRGFGQSHSAVHPPTGSVAQDREMSTPPVHSSDGVLNSWPCVTSHRTRTRTYVELT